MDRMFALLVERLDGLTNSQHLWEPVVGTWSSYRSVVAGRGWWNELGDTGESWSRHSTADMAMHASNELVHHAAEMALLRDLYRTSFAEISA